jgi:L-ascorbate metabolism protein UlaG (beta-lactamase superfamily)
MSDARSARTTRAVPSSTVEPGKGRRQPWSQLVLGVAVAASTAPSALAAVALSSAGGSGGAAAVAVSHLANAGVMISRGESRVVIDALFGDGLAGYPVVAARERADLEAARGRFAGVDLVLATHLHADHFDAAAVVRHLQANPGALFVSTPEAVAAVRAQSAAVALAGRLRAVLPPEREHETIRHSGVTVTVFQLHHGRALTRPVTNLGFLVELGGRRIVHLGDTEATADELAATGLASSGVDLALVPFWRLLDDDGRNAIDRALRPTRVAAIHVPRLDADDDYFGAAGGRRALDARVGLPASRVEIFDEAAPDLVFDANLGGR